MSYEYTTRRVYESMWIPAASL